MHLIAAFSDLRTEVKYGNCIHLQASVLFWNHVFIATDTTSQRYADLQTLSSGVTIPPQPPLDIRTRLRQWQTQHEQDILDGLVQRDVPTEDFGSGMNTLTRPDDGKQIFEGHDELDTDLEAFNALIRTSDRIQVLADNMPISSEVVYEIGDVVQLFAGAHKSLIAVYLGMSGADRVYFTQNNTLRFAVDSKQIALFCSKGLLDEAEVEHLLQYIPSTPMNTAQQASSEFGYAVPRDAGSSVAIKLRKFSSDVQAAYRTHIHAIDDAHDSIAHPTETRHVALEDIAIRLTGSELPQDVYYREALLCAISSALTTREFGFRIWDAAFAKTRVLIVYSRKMASVVRNVKAHVRAYEEYAALSADQNTPIPQNLHNAAGYLRDFALRCAKLVEISRKIRQYDPRGEVLATKPAFSQEKTAASRYLQSFSFKESDKDFIRFLMLDISMSAFKAHWLLKSITYGIIRAIGVYENLEEIDLLPHTFLVEIGVIQPFENPETWDEWLRPPDACLYGELENMNLAIKSGEKPEDAAELTDSLVNIRKDWNDLPVYCIDGFSTVEVDDGISLESVIDAPGQSWLRVHVSHISAFTSPDHVLGRLANRTVESHYLDDTKVGMLPHWISNFASVAPGKPVLTISMRLDEDANVLEYGIEAGRVHNVQTVRLNDVNDFFGESESSSTNLQKYGISHDRLRPQEVPEPRRVTVEQAEFLQKVHALSIKLKIKAERPFEGFGPDKEGFNVSEVRVSRQGNMYPLAATMAAPLDKAKFDLWDPDIELRMSTITKRGASPTTGENLVQECMVLANITAGRWAHDRKMVIPYTGSDLVAQGSVVKASTLTNMRDEGATFARLSATLKTSYKSQVGTRRDSVDPIAHRALNTTCYARVTSPLRRYHDLLAHWQIDAVLRGDPSLPLERHALSTILRVVELRRSITAVHSWNHTKWLRILAIARAFHLGHGTLPDKITVSCRGANMDDDGITIHGRCEELAVAAKIEGGALGEVWEAKLIDVNLSERRIVVKAIRKLKDHQPIFFGDE